MAGDVGLVKKLGMRLLLKVCVGAPDDGESGSGSDDDEEHDKNEGDSGTDAVWQTGVYVSGE
eukprot:13071696-Alexandrium_andersonii.AAC.1